jgi:two-component system OmpR family response regulator
MTVRQVAAAHGPPLTRRDGGALRALVVDDEQQLAEIISDLLRLEGWQVATAIDGRSALQARQRLEPDVVILDVSLPDGDGFQLLTEMRKAQPELCVLFLSSRTAIEDRIAGLRAGADDYVTKPFSFQEVLVRLQGLVRRSGLSSSTSQVLLQVGDLVLDPATREVRRQGRSIELTATEFELLRLLMLNSGRVVSKSEILEGVWGQGFAVQGHIVELYISYLRRKVDVGFAPMIRTVRGVGYLLRAAES